MTIIDPVAYSKIEKMYLANTPITIQRAFSLEVFRNTGFPTQIQSILELSPLINTMQEDRFKKYFDELGGVNSIDLNIFIENIKKHIKFQAKYWPNRKCKLSKKSSAIIPLDTMMSGLLIAKKLSYFAPNAKNIIEFGPGVAQTAFFLDKYLPNLNTLTYVEACQSFYILQSLIMDYLFSDNFNEEAHEEIGSRFTWDELIRESNDHNLEKRFTGNISHGQNLMAFHYPWFKFPEIVKSDIKFDLVMANACLNEMSIASLKLYLSGLQKIVSKDALFFYQCPGWNHDNRDIVSILNEFGFNLIFASSINAAMNFGKTSMRWETPTPTALFRYSGGSIEMASNDSMAYSKGEKPFAIPEIFPILEKISGDMLTNHNFYDFTNAIENELTLI